MGDTVQERQPDAMSAGLLLDLLYRERTVRERRSESPSEASTDTDLEAEQEAEQEAEPRRTAREDDAARQASTGQRGRTAQHAITPEAAAAPHTVKGFDAHSPAGSTGEALAKQVRAGTGSSAARAWNENQESVGAESASVSSGEMCPLCARQCEAHHRCGSCGSTPIPTRPDPTPPHTYIILRPLL